MSDLIVQCVKVDDVFPHDNADRLEIAKVEGWYCVIGKGQFKKGDKAVYIPIDSVLPDDLIAKIFANSKIQLKTGRVKTIKIRGSISQGLLTSFEVLQIPECKLGTDLKDVLEITKYEPKPPFYQKHCGKGKRTWKRRYNHPEFKRYTNIQNYKNNIRIFIEGELVSITEKIHGSNMRASILKRDKKGFFKEMIFKIKTLFGYGKEYEFCYGSHNVQLSVGHATYYGGDPYFEMVLKYDLQNKLGKNETIYGEVYGASIQKNYMYGCNIGERKAIFFDLRRNDAFLSPKEFEKFCKEKDLPMSAILFEGTFNEEEIKKLATGDSVFYPEQKIIEGIVIKAQTECGHPKIGRKVLKLINDEYLLKDNSDFH